eukprot:COSAG05_NODE_314_length_11610_cov_17.223265_5_plen_85_part_00
MCAHLIESFSCSACNSSDVLRNFSFSMMLLYQCINNFSKTTIVLMVYTVFLCQEPGPGRYDLWWLIFSGYSSAGDSYFWIYFAR